MQHDHVLKKSNFDLLTPSPSEGKIFATMQNLNIRSLTLPKGSGGWGKFFITAMLIYRHWVIMAYREKLSDIIVLGKCEVYSTKKANIAFAFA